MLLQLARKPTLSCQRTYTHTLWTFAGSGEVHVAGCGWLLQQCCRVDGCSPAGRLGTERENSRADALEHKELSALFSSLNPQPDVSVRHVLWRSAISCSSADQFRSCLLHQKISEKFCVYAWGEHLVSCIIWHLSSLYYKFPGSANALTKIQCIFIMQTYY